MKTALKIPTVPGAPFAGGLYCRRLFEGTQAYVLVVAPAFAGDLSGVTHKQALAKVKKLKIGGVTGWTLPSRIEALAMFEDLRDVVKGTDDEFARDAYWTSQQSASYSDFAWCQSFYDGYQYDDLKSVELRARAVRRVEI